MAVPVPPCPSSLKGVQHYLTIAAEHDVRDGVVSYWCRLYALQQGLKIDKSSPEAKKLLFFLMDWLEAEKSKEKDNDAIVHDVAAQAYLENYALKLFMKADEQDRAGIFNKNVVKSFYTAGMLYSLLEMFGELTEEVAKNQKYAKWKAAYIHNCLKNGETPVPGPVGGDDEQQMGFTMPNPGSNIPFTQPAAGPGYPSDTPSFPMPGSSYPPPAAPPSNPPDLFPPVQPTPPRPVVPEAPAPASLPYNIPPGTEQSTEGPTTVSGVPLTAEMVAKAQKLCKYASSALNYEDVNTAVSNLRQALDLLTTGKH